MKLIHLKNILEYLEIKKKSLRNHLLNELKSNDSVSFDNVDVIIKSIDGLYSQELEVKCNVSLTNNLNMYRGILLNKYILNLKTILSKINFYNSVINELIEYSVNKNVSISDNLKLVISNLQEALDTLEEDVISLKSTIFEFDSNVEMTTSSRSEDGTDTTEQEQDSVNN